MITGDQLPITAPNPTSTLSKPSQANHEPRTVGGRTAASLKQATGKVNNNQPIRGLTQVTQRSVVLSYLLYHGHRDTARVFAKEIACREAEESVERCPLWQPRDHTSDIDKVMRTPDEADSTLGHGQGINDLRLDATAISHLNELGVAHTHKSVVPESTLVDVEARRSKFHHPIY